MSTISTMLPPGQEDVLRQIGRYHCLTGDQATRLTRSPSARTATMAILKALTDQKVLVNVGKKRQKGYWTYMEPGRRLLSSLGYTVPQRRSYGQGEYFLKHLEAVNDVLITLERFTVEAEGVDLCGMLHDRDFPRTGVTPDGWVDLSIGGDRECYWIEADRGTEHRPTWGRKVTEIIHQYRSGTYERAFGTDVLTSILVVAIPPKDAPVRKMELRAWTEEVLVGLNKQGWGNMFLFTDVDPTTVSAFEFMTGHHWRRPFDMDYHPVIEGRDEESA